MASLPSLKRATTKELHFQLRQAEAKEWIEEVLDLKGKLKDDLSESLRDGIILCRLMQKINPGSVREPVPTSNSPFKMMQNVEYFLSACRKYGVKHHFLTQDLVNKSNMNDVIQTIHALSKQAEKNGFRPVLIRTITEAVYKKPYEKLVQKLGHERELWVKKINEMKQEHIRKRTLSKAQPPRVLTQLLNGTITPKTPIPTQLESKPATPMIIEEEGEEEEEEEERREISFGAKTDPGTRYNNLNQDSFVCKVFENKYLRGENVDQPKCYFWGVFDGHSQLGEFASKICSEKFVTLVNKHLEEAWSKGKKFLPTEEDMKKMFEDVNHTIIDYYPSVPKKYNYPVDDEEMTFCLEERDGDFFYVNKELDEARMLDFGTTAVVAILVGDYLLVANVGDSECAIGKTSAGELKGCAITQVHNCDNEDEIDRIKKEFPDTEFSEDGYLVVTHNKINEYYLAMTRALGHKWLNKFGVSWVPYVYTETYTDRHQFLVLASDGVWDEIDPESVINFVDDCCNDNLTAQETAEKLVEKALFLADEDDKDNTTAIVVFL